MNRSVSSATVVLNWSHPQPRSHSWHNLAASYSISLSFFLDIWFLDRFSFCGIINIVQGSAARLDPDWQRAGGVWLLGNGGGLTTMTGGGFLARMNSLGQSTRVRNTKVYTCFVLIEIILLLRRYLHRHFLKRYAAARLYQHFKHDKQSER